MTRTAAKSGLHSGTHVEFVQTSSKEASMKPVFYSALVLTLLCAVCVVTTVGCKSNEPPPKPVATIENLKVAHACAFKRSMWYGMAADAAEKERLGNLAMMFRAISRSEAIHASLHEQLLQSKTQSTDTSK